MTAIFGYRAVRAFLPALTLGAIILFGNAAHAASSAEIIEMFKQDPRMIYAALAGAAALMFVLLLVASRRGKRNTRKSVAAYDRQLEDYREQLRRNAK